jgi:hypothetical protein
MSKKIETFLFGLTVSVLILIVLGSIVICAIGNE